MAEPSPIRIVVADCHPLFTLGVRSLFAAHPSIQIVGEAEDGEHTLKLLEATRPDVLLLDLGLTRVSGLEVLNRLAALKLRTRTIILSATVDRAEIRTAVLRGAQGVMLKSMATEMLVKCIHQVMKGEYWIPRDAVGELIEALRDPARGDDASGLSHRERDIVNAVIRGASNKDIAWQLGLGEQTVKNHLRRIFAKLHVSNRVELAVYAMEHQIAESADREIGPQ